VFDVFIFVLSWILGFILQEKFPSANAKV